MSLNWRFATVNDWGDNGSKKLPLLRQPGYFMNHCREITKVGVPPGNRPADRGIGSEAYLNGTSQGSTPEDARKDGHIRGRSK